MTSRACRRNRHRRRHLLASNGQLAVSPECTTQHPDHPRHVRWMMSQPENTVYEAYVPSLVLSHPSGALHASPSNGCDAFVPVRTKKEAKQDDVK